MPKNILENIWNGTIELRDGQDLSPSSHALCSLFGAPTIRLTVRVSRNDVKPFALFAGDEISHGASLADVLFEELGIEVSDDSIVLFEPIPVHLGIKKPAFVQHSTIQRMELETIQ